jgi:hypothetical protein
MWIISIKNVGCYRLKLEKSEPVTPAYKVDVSFLNMPSMRKAEKLTSKSTFASSGSLPNPTVGSNNTSGSATLLTSATTATSATASAATTTASGGANAAMAVSSGGVTSGEEPRVPPLHISLRGRNASVVQIGKKEKKLLKESELDLATIKRRGKLKKLKEATEGNKLLQKKSLNMIIGLLLVLLCLKWLFMSTQRSIAREFLNLAI